MYDWLVLFHITLHLPGATEMIVVSEQVCRYICMHMYVCMYLTKVTFSSLL
jgi:hypothetical protein